MEQKWKESNARLFKRTGQVVPRRQTAMQSGVIQLEVGLMGCTCRSRELACKDTLAFCGCWLVGLFRSELLGVVSEMRKMGGLGSVRSPSCISDLSVANITSSLHLLTVDNRFAACEALHEYSQSTGHSQSSVLLCLPDNREYTKCLLITRKWSPRDAMFVHFVWVADNYPLSVPCPGRSMEPWRERLCTGC